MLSYSLTISAAMKMSYGFWQFCCCYLTKATLICLFIYSFIYLCFIYLDGLTIGENWVNQFTIYCMYILLVNVCANKFSVKVKSTTCCCDVC